MPPSDSQDGTGNMAIERCRDMRQQATSPWDAVLDASQKHDERQPFAQVTEALDSPERSSERLEWELTRWPEGAEL
jgi:hypothetical protein